MQLHLTRPRPGALAGRLHQWAAIVVKPVHAGSPPASGRTPGAVGDHYNAVVIGSGFGGSLAGLTVARAMAQRGLGEQLLMLERGSWWTTPLSTVEDKHDAVASFLRGREQPVQYVSTVDHFTGSFDLLLRCVRRPGNPDGLYGKATLGAAGAGAGP